MDDWSLPADLSKPTPRKVGMSGTFKGTVVLIVGLFATLVLPISAIGYSVFHKAEVLKDRGVEVAGVVERTYTTISRKAYQYHVVYTFTPKGLAGAAPSAIRAEAVVSSTDFQKASPGRRLPIMYDPSDLSNSRPNIADEVRKAEPFDVVKLTLLAVLGFVSVALLLCSFRIVRYFRDSAILRWGQAVPATIVREEEQTTRGGPTSKVTYRFKDATGKLVEGSQKYVPTATDSRPGFSAHRMKFMFNPTVVFDPKDSARNILYPSTSAELR